MSLTNSVITPTQANAVSGVATSTTSFSPAAGTLVAVPIGYMFSTNATGVTFAVADSSGTAYTVGVTLDQGGFGGGYNIIAYHQYVSAPGSITVKVTASNTGTAAALISPIVFTGQAASPIGPNTLSSTSGSSTSTCQGSITTTASGSYVVISGAGGGSSTMNVIAGTTADGAWNDTGIGGTVANAVTSAVTGTPGATTVGWTLGTTLTFGYGIVGLEILPSTGFTATGSAKLGNLGVSGTGSVGAIFTSTGSVGLGTLGASGTGALGSVATGSAKLGSLGASGTVAVPFVGSGSVALGAHGVSATGSVPFVGSGSAAVGLLGASGITAVGFVGSGSVRLGALGASGAGKPGVIGSGSVRLGALGCGAIEFDTAPLMPIFPGADLDVSAELNLAGTWTDISPYVFQDTSVIQRGHPDESTTAAPSAFSATLDNSDGRFSSLNPLSPYYGKTFGLNTEIRVSVPEGSTYMRLENDTASGASCPSSVAINALTSFEVWFDGDCDNWFTPQILACKWNATGNQRSWALCLPGDGTVQLIICSDGSSTRFFAATIAHVPAHGRLSIRSAYNQATGVVTFYTGQYCQSWTRLGVTTTFATKPTPFASTASLEVGTCVNFDFPEVGFQGKIYACAVLSGVNPTISSAVAVADFTGLVTGSTTWTDAKGNSWSLEGTSELSDRNYRFHGEVSSWPQTWSPGGNNARVNISAGGLLRRMAQGNIPVQSAMYRAYVRAAQFGFTPLAYWPCEDGAKATQLGSAIGGPPMTLPVGIPSLASYSGFTCSAPLPTTGGGGEWVGTVPPYAVSAFGSSTGTDAIVRFLLAIPAGGDVTNGIITSIFYTGGPLARIDLTYINGGVLAINGYDFNNNLLWTSGGFSFTTDGNMQRVSIEVRAASLTTYTASFSTLKVGQTVGGGVTAVTGATGAVGAVYKVAMNSGPTLLTSSSIGHVSVQNTWTTLFDMTGPLNAYQGELAATRFARLCSEEGIAYRGIGYIADTPLMGPQTIEALPALLQECADVDQGMWFEPRQVLGFGYRTRASLGNQVAAFSLDYNQDHVSDTLTPTLDDQNVKNDITVTAANSGSSSRQTLDDDSPLSIGGAGRYDTSVTLNTASDTQLDSEAGWLLHLLTVNEPRYPGIKVDLANRALASMYNAILNTEVGDRVTISNPPFWLPPGLVDQVVLGMTETLSRKALSESYNGRPSSPWNVAVGDDVVYGRADTDGSTLTVGVNSVATSLSVATTNAGSPLWSTSGGDVPFDIIIGGERMTVTAVTGSSSPQVFTVVRAVNGVVKSQATGADVRLFIPPIVSL